jgi:hypothetical protein
MVELGHLRWFGHIARIWDERYPKMTWHTRTQRNRLYPASAVILLFSGNIGGMETTRKMRQIEVTETAPFTEVKPLNVYQSTHTYILLAALTPPNCPVFDGFLVSPSTYALPNSKSDRYRLTVESKLNGKNARHHKVSFSVGQPTSIL